MEKIRVLLADDHAVVRQGLRALLEAEPDIAVVAEAGNGRQAVDLARSLTPDVVVMDVAMPTLNGVEAIRQIAREVPSAKLLVLSSYDDEDYVEQVTEAGAAGYLLKQMAVTELIKAVREAPTGEGFLSCGVSGRLVERRREAGKKRGLLLTSREMEVLQLIAEGRANKQIAAELGISVKTVETHRQRVMEKLDIHDIAGLTRYALSRGVIERGARLRF